MNTLKYTFYVFDYYSLILKILKVQLNMLVVFTPDKKSHTEIQKLESCL